MRFKEAAGDISCRRIFDGLRTPLVKRGCVGNRLHSLGSG
jgi:hypothetical protein